MTAVIVVGACLMVLGVLLIVWGRRRRCQELADYAEARAQAHYADIESQLQTLRDQRIELIRRRAPHDWAQTGEL